MLNPSLSTSYDCFNGDADGICALIQWRKAYPLSNKINTQLVTGIKRDIALVANINATENDQVAIFDLSFDKNREAVLALLKRGVTVFYSDHHYVGIPVKHKNLTTIIDTSPNICTSLLINQHINHAYYYWAIVGASGDNLQVSAKQLADRHSVSYDDFLQLEKLGIYINYNGYGSHLDDLHFHPAMLYQALAYYDNPLDFIVNNPVTFNQLAEGYADDMANANNAIILDESNTAIIFQLPDQKWARRVSGVFINDQANQSPNKAHAVLTYKADGAYQVSVRAPLTNKIGADVFCRGFSTGGGRAAAAGINTLNKKELASFITQFKTFFN